MQSQQNTIDFPLRKARAFSVQLIVVLTFLASMVFSACTKKTETTSNTSTGSQSSATSHSGDEILIGEVGSLTGNEATFGKSNHEGVQLAVDQLNATGGVKGKKFRVILMDNQGKPDEAATAVTKLITQDRVSAIIGEVASSRSLAMAPIAQMNRVPMVTPSSTNPKVTQIGDFIFRVCFIDPFQGEVMAKFAANSLKLKKVAILKDVKNDYSVGLAEFFKQTFTKLGGQIVKEESYSANDVDFKSQLTSIKTKAPEAVFVPGYYTEVGLIARQARELGIKAPLLGGDGWDSSKLQEIAGNAIEGSYFSNHYSPDGRSAAAEKFIKDYKAKYNVVPDGLAAMGYDAMMVLADAMKRAKSLSNEDIRQALAETKEFPGVTGNISMDRERNAVKPAVVLEVKPKGFVYKETIQPS